MLPTNPSKQRCIRRVVLALVALTAGCLNERAPAPVVPAQSSPITLRVAAAANLKFALDKIRDAFEEQQAGVELEITYGSSGNLYAQISQGAPFDLFFSADTSYPRRLRDAGLVTEDGYFPYAKGRIVLWVLNDSPLDLEKSGMQVLVDPAVKKIAIANPKLAPYGEAAVSAMKQQGLFDQLEDRLVFGENITQTAQFVDSGAADVGFLAMSLTLAPPMKSRGRYWEIPREDYEPIEQAAAILSRSKHQDAADQLRDFVTTGQGQNILESFGYLPPGA